MVVQNPFLSYFCNLLAEISLEVGNPAQRIILAMAAACHATKIEDLRAGAFSPAYQVPHDAICKRDTLITRVAPAPVCRVPYLEGDVSDLDGLKRVARVLTD